MKVDPGDSKLALPDVVLRVVSVSRTNYPDRLVEIVELENGFVRLDLAAGGGGFSDFTSDRAFRALFSNIASKVEAMPGESFEPRRKHRITYARFSVEGPCIVFVRPIGRPLPHAVGGHTTHDGSLSGIYCGSFAQADFTKFALALIKRITLTERKPASGRQGDGTSTHKTTIKENKSPRSY